MRRRDFLIAGCLAAARSAWVRADETLPDLKVTRVVGFQLPSQRSKIAGKNARLDVHGDRATDTMLRIYTKQGIEGLGNCRAPQAAAAQLLGKNPLYLHNGEERTFSGPLGAGTMPLWDLAGKMLKQPVYQILGNRGPEKVPVYDGSIYFADLLPQYTDKWQDRFREEMDMGLKLGHRGFKIKIGRGGKWMPRQAGDDRDVEVLKIIRSHVGPDVRLHVDANNGYNLEGTKAFLKRAGDLNLAFVEEMFPETVPECLDLKAFIRQNGWKTLLADGETQHELKAYRPFVEAKAIDVYQGDMNHFGIEGILQEAKWAEESGALIAPHNWGSLVGYYQELHVGRAIPNIYSAEHDPLSTDVLIADGYSIKDGKATVSEKPGFGLELDADKFAKQAKILFDLKA